MDRSGYYLALDIGGTKTSGALFDNNGTIVGNRVRVVPSRTSEGEEAVYRNVRGLAERVLSDCGILPDEVLGIGIGSPGPLDAERGIILHAPLMGWRNFPLAARMAEDFGRPVRLDNDGNLGALAEQRCGVAKGLSHVLYMTVSTGCGGGLILNGEPYRGAHDGAGEVGHMSIDPEGLPCPCGGRGCFELYASGTALLRTMREDMLRGVMSRVFDAAEHRPENLNGNLLTRAAAEGDEYALSLYQREGYYLGVGIANLFNLWDPEVIVLGGGVTKARAFFADQLMKTFRERCIHPVRNDSVRYSEMNDRVVLHGAYHLIQEDLRERDSRERDSIEER